MTVTFQKCQQLHIFFCILKLIDANQKNVNKHKDGDDEFIVAKGHVSVGLVGLVGLVGRTYGFVLVGTLWSRVGRWSRGASVCQWLLLHILPHSAPSSVPTRSSSTHRDLELVLCSQLSYTALMINNTKVFLHPPALKEI